MTLVGVLTELAAFYFLSRAIGPGFRPGGIEYFPFLMVGTGLYTFFVMSAQAFLSAVQEAQQTGTLEVLMTTSTAPAELVILSSISAFAGSLVNLLVYFFAGVAVFRASVHANFLSCAVVLFFLWRSRWPWESPPPRFRLRSRRARLCCGCSGSGLWFLSGTMFPIQSFAPSPRTSRAALPFTYAIDGMRRALLEGRSVAAHGAHAGGAGGVWSGSAAARSGRPVVEFAARAPGWNAFFY